jgi:hypothetical protein
VASASFLASSIGFGILGTGIFGMLGIFGIFGILKPIVISP